MPTLKPPKPPINGRKPSEPAAPPPPELFSPELQRLLESVARHWGKTLPDRVVIHDLLLSRGVTGEAVQELGIGYSDGKLGSVLPSENTDEGRRIRALLFASGVLDGHGRERFAGCLVFPVRDKDSVIVNVYGITPDAAREVFLPYPCPLYHVRALIAHDVTVTRSIFEFLALYGKGEHAVVFAHAGLAPEEIAQMTDRQPETPPAGQPDAAQPDVTPAAAPPMPQDVRLDKDTARFTFGERTYRVDALSKNRAHGSLSVTIHAERESALFIEKTELYQAKDREKFVRLCALELGSTEDVIRADLSRMVRVLREHQDKMIEEAGRPREKPVIVVPAHREGRALEFLRTPDFRRLMPAHARSMRLVGEQINFELGFYILLSRILSKPLHGKVKSASASGKSTFLDVLARMCPVEDLVRLSALSGNALYYMEDLAHRVILLEEDAGMEFALYPLKILQTEGILRKGTVFRDPQTGKAAAVQTEVEGPVASLVASTSTIEREEEDNRYLLLAMNESYEQTQAVLEDQRMRETEDQEELDRQSRHTAELYQDVLRLIKNRPVLNPYAPRLSFMIRRHRFRRDQPKVLRLVRLITLAHQFQRTAYHETKDGITKEYLLSTIEDNVLAVELAGHALGRSLDEMSPHTRHFLSRFRELTAEMSETSGTEKRYCRPLRRDLARKTGLSASTVHEHLQALYRLDYIAFYKDDRRRDIIELIEDGTEEAAGIPDAGRLALELAAWEAQMRAAHPGKRDWWRGMLKTKAAL